MEKVIKFLKDEEGVPAMEYVLLAAIAATALLALTGLFWDTLVTKLSSIATTIAAQ